MPQHGADPDSTSKNIGYYAILQVYGLVAAFIASLIFEATADFVADSHPLVTIVRVIVFAVIITAMLLAVLWYLTTGFVQQSVREQYVLLKDKNTWIMVALYLGQSGSFIGYSKAFPMLIDEVFGTLANGEINPNAPDPENFAFMGAMFGSLARVAGGFLADKVGGGACTNFALIVQILCSIIVGVVINSTLESNDPGVLFIVFVIFKLIMFTATGFGNASTFQQMGVLLNSKVRGPTLGFAAAVAGYGASLVPTFFDAGIQDGFIAYCFFSIALYYILSVYLNYNYYYRKDAPFPC
jgi:NNP family nitrate/nitrite transporter-like MFS transporter